jgi:hypothetical protein
MTWLSVPSEKWNAIHSKKVFWREWSKFGQFRYKYSGVLWNNSGDRDITINLGMSTEKMLQLTHSLMIKPVSKNQSVRTLSEIWNRLGKWREIKFWDPFDLSCAINQTLKWVNCRMNGSLGEQCDLVCGPFPIVKHSLTSPHEFMGVNFNVRCRKTDSRWSADQKSFNRQSSHIKGSSVDSENIRMKYNDIHCDYRQIA